LIAIHGRGSIERMDPQITRRQVSWIAGGLCGVVSAQAQVNQGESGKPGTSLHQEIDYEAAPARIYAALLDAKQFSAFTKDAAEIEPQAGGAFKLFGGRVAGRHVELIANRRIVQAWRSASWPSGEYSIVRFELTARGTGTRIVLDHAGFTADKWEDLNAGWGEHYWEPLRKYLG
jgi:activator of HSP90 ATPase